MKLNAQEQYVYEGLMKRGLPSHVALGFVMNIRDESGFKPDIVEHEPNVHGTRGKGYLQLTGSRRKEFEKRYGKWTPDNQMDNTLRELRGPEKRAFKQIMMTETPGEAAAAIATHFQRPAKEHLDKRVQKYLGGPMTTEYNNRRDYLRQFMSDEDIDNMIAAGGIPSARRAPTEMLADLKQQRNELPSQYASLGGMVGDVYVPNPGAAVQGALRRYQNDQGIADARGQLAGLDQQEGGAEMGYTEAAINAPYQPTEAEMGPPGMVTPTPEAPPQPPQAPPPQPPGVPFGEMAGPPDAAMPYGMSAGNAVGVQDPQQLAALIEALRSGEQPFTPFNPYS